jgi:hypothetical protein
MMTDTRAMFAALTVAELDTLTDKLCDAIDRGRRRVDAGSLAVVTELRAVEHDAWCLRCARTGVRCLQCAQ